MMPELADRADNALRFDRFFAGPPELVFSLWTEPSLVAVWFASSHGFRADVDEYDVRPGGLWRLTNRKGTVIEHPHGVFHEVVPDRRLIYSYQFLGTDFHSTISIELSPERDGTRLRFCQTGFPDVGSRDDHEGGWGIALKMFADVLLAQHGVGTVYPGIGQERISAVARDLEAARQRFEEEQRVAKKK
jgi:uncharacterized protein YndB with AHSA1/START domain